MSVLPAQPNQSLLDGLEVLLALAQHQEPVGVRALARELGMHPTRVQRFLGTLHHLGLTRQEPNRRYGVGPGIHALSALALSASGLTQRALRILPSVQEPGLILALGVLWRNTVNYLYFNEPGLPAAEALGKAHGYPAADSSIGLLLLATKEDAYLTKYFPDEAVILRARLPEVRATGVARIDRPDGEISLAVPLGHPAYAGLAFSGRFPPSEVPDRLAQLRQIAAQLEPHSTSHPL